MDEGIESHALGAQGEGEDFYGVEVVHCCDEGGGEGLEEEVEEDCCAGHASVGEKGG